MNAMKTAGTLSGQKFDMTSSADLSSLKILETNSKNDCYIKSSDGTAYGSFILARNNRNYTECLVNFSKGDDKYIPRLTFQIVKNNGDIDEANKGNDRTRRIEFKVRENGLNNFWLLISYLKSFRDLVEVDEFEKEYSVMNGTLKSLLEQMSDEDVEFALEQAGKDGAVVVTENNLKKIVKKFISEDLYHQALDELAKSEEVDLTEFIDEERNKKRREVIRLLRERLESGIDYPETSGNDSWQKFIHDNHWLAGVNYVKPIEKAKINLSGVMPDFMYPSVDGFIDIFELKLPKHPVIKQDPDHEGSWVWRSNVSAAIGQVVNYLEEMGRFRLEIENKIKDVYSLDVAIIRPRAIILIGRSNGWSQPQKNALRKLNSFLHDIEVMTYDELLARAERLVK